MGKQIFTDKRWIGRHGIGRYTTEILQRIPEVQDLCVSGKPLSITDPFLLASALKRKSPCLFYNPGFNAPLGWDGISILTIHDLIHLDDPVQSSYVKRQYYKHIIKPQVLKAPIVFTVSEFSKARIQDWLKIPEKRILVAPNGVSDQFAKHAHHAKKENYIVYVGTSRSHKNTARMLQAFALINDQSLNFTWVGDISKEDHLLAQTLGLGKKLKVISHASDSELAGLYAKARGTVLVSTLEGFGLPPLESTLCGTRSLISQNNPLANELAHLAITADPSSVDSIVEGLDRLILNSSFSNDEKEKISALKVIYNWDKTATFIQDTLRSLT